MDFSLTYTGYQEMMNQWHKEIIQGQSNIKKCREQLYKAINTLGTSRKLSQTTNQEQNIKSVENFSEVLTRLNKTRTNKKDTAPLGGAAKAYLGNIVRKTVINVFSKRYGVRCDIKAIMSSFFYDIDSNYQPIFKVVNQSMLQNAINPDIYGTRKAFNQNANMKDFRKESFDILEGQEQADFYGLLDGEVMFMDGDYDNMDSVMDSGLYNRKVDGIYGTDYRIIDTTETVIREIETIVKNKYREYFNGVIAPKIIQIATR